MYRMQSFACIRFVCIIFSFIAGGNHCALAQLIVNSSCPLVSVERNFSLKAVRFCKKKYYNNCRNINIIIWNQYSGVWHEIESYPSQVEEFDICVSLNYTQASEDLLQVVSTWFNTRYYALTFITLTFFTFLWLYQQTYNSSRKYESVQGSARLVNPRLGARLQISYSNNIDSNRIVTTEGNYLVLETDYTNYAIIYFCVPGVRNDSARKSCTTVLLKRMYNYRSWIF